MSEWYYARGGQQNGPVTFEQLLELAGNGGLDATKDQVWTAAMKDWAPAGQVPGLFTTAPGTLTPAAPAASGALPEITPGSEPLDVAACVKRGFELTKRQFGIILLVGLAYFGVSFGVSIILGLLDAALGLGHSSYNATYFSYQHSGSPLNMLVSQVLSSFLALGAARIGLNLVSGKEVTVAMLFGEGRKLLRALGATIMFVPAMMVGMLLLVVPGVYIAMRYGQYMMAIVDRDMGIMEAFAYSSSLTTNNRMNLFLLGLLAVAIIFAGMLACGVGLIFALPVVWLAQMTAYRWMQYGNRAVLDHPGTQTPLLAGQ